ncbi:uncharacterized protein LOC131939673 [Physella acuta]|uniref:uncharacterized protein LOC131939673 n=1 Tax=Physella acuta TaxID=109671 RepID=UPI0027DC3929|nr:uncharacterized protein LOC131939673 [Physella acuta]
MSQTIGYPRSPLGCLVICLSLCLSHVGSMAVEVPFIAKQILIYGGNGFIGSSTAERLIAAGHNLTLVNRGNWYWDSGYTIKPFVHHIQCDRLQPGINCEELMYYTANSEKIDVVIDFSAYHPETLTQSLQKLGAKTKLYIFISTDSVYDVCEKSHTEPSRESDAVRPSSQEVREKLEREESYGHRKLMCEEILSTFRQEKNGPAYVILRLPDVVGPRDNTYRWWVYQLWMKLRPFLEQDVVISERTASQPMSLVYVEDVANLIVSLVNKVPPAAVDQVFNVAQKETITLKEFVNGIKNELNLTNINIFTSSKPDTIMLLPSIRSGPVDVTKAEQILNWTTTPWNKVVKDTCSFYEDAVHNIRFDKHLKDMIRNLQTYLTSKPYEVIQGFDEVYGLSFANPKDEL